jgi:hypothetical protein
VTRSCTAGALAARVGWGLAVAAAADEDRSQTRETMREIFEAIYFVLPLSLDGAAFRAPAQRDAIVDALSRLERNAATLETHGRDASFSFLGAALAREARDVRRRFERGQIEEASFGLQRLTDACATCHSRLPSERQSSLGRRLVDDARVASLPLPARARLETATRQFDAALRSYEELMRSEAFPPYEMGLRGQFADYLEICIRVRDDFERPRPVLEKLGAGGRLPAYLRDDVASWLRSLRVLAGRPRGESDLATGRALLREAEDPARFADRSAALVYYIAASAALHRSVATPAEGAAEAYYRLGVIESRIGRSYRFSQTEHLLATSIRLAPRAPFARDALALLEEFVASGYTGSAGENVPPEVRRQLEELERLVGDS